ncbi:ABC transporter permease [Rhizobium sp. LEGMi135b]
MSAAGRKRRERVILLSICSVLFLITLAPILSVFVLSFSASGTLEFPPSGFSVQWYRAVFDMFAGNPVAGGAALSSGSGRLIEALLTTLKIAGATTALTAILAVPVSYAIVRYDFRGKGVVEQIISLPTVYPLVALGISFLIVTGAAGFTDGFWRIVAAHTIVTFPFMVRNCTASLAGVSVSFEEVAATLGARPASVFAKITLPLMAPGVAAGMMLAFILSSNEFTATYFLYSNETIPFSIWIYSQASNELNPAVFALAGLFILINIVMIWIVETLSDPSTSARRAS